MLYMKNTTINTNLYKRPTNQRSSLGEHAGDDRLSHTGWTGMSGMRLGCTMGHCGPAI